MAFTIKELREMTKLPGCRPDLSPEDFDAIRSLVPGMIFRAVARVMVCHKHWSVSK